MLLSMLMYTLDIASKMSNIRLRWMTLAAPQKLVYHLRTYNKCILKLNSQDWWPILKLSIYCKCLAFSSSSILLRSSISRMKRKGVSLLETILWGEKPTGPQLIKTMYFTLAIVIYTPFTRAHFP